MKVSVRCFGFPLTWYRPIAETAEQEGFHGLWIPDHVVSPTMTDGKYPYSAHGRPSFDPATPFADPLVMAGHLAAATSRIRLGIGVYVLPLRHPLIAARSVMSAQELSGGRLVLGVGVGWMRTEFESLDQEFSGRGGRTEEMLDVMRRAWTGEPVRHEGRWYSFPELTVAPPVTAPVPVLIGGASERALARAVQHGEGWYGPPGTADQTATYVTALQAELERQGRERSSFHIVARAPEDEPLAGVRALAERDVDEVVLNLPRAVAEVGEVTSWITEAAARLRADGALS
ncbi:TIGR03619 family F420-dependent LLM class oxidoreductase [Nonomuraea sp. NPDC049486]|uniref:TIGR03619 family F420-dependent LLM class oxidoreductase n=1 Tax=Nonomuraea sp. NPDC049486 TaxID=3155773 RepID=UPI00343B87F2